MIKTDWNWSVGEDNEGQWFIHEPDGRTGPYPSELAAREAVTVYLCCDCMVQVDMVMPPTECEDDCNISLDHAGLCHPHGPETDETCSRCGAHGFVKALAAGDF